MAAGGREGTARDTRHSRRATATGHDNRHQRQAALYDMLATASAMAVTTKAMSPSPDHARCLLRTNGRETKT